MKVIASGRLAQTASRYGEHAPTATACCNACRTCVTTNLIGLALAAAAGAGGFLTSRTRRRASRSLR
ncbi:MAG TPA: hypothetical protein VNR59_11100 [Gaiellaceae bacterium]|nr:hypothetical protein [Thermoleophilia bacterium]HWJ32877.1 hypothetical protein [Gaiellaceae bacterium]